MIFMTTAIFYAMKNTTVFVQFYVFFPPNQPNKQSPINMSKTEKLKVSCIPSLDIFLCDPIISGWPQRAFEFSHNIF